VTQEENHLGTEQVEWFLSTPVDNREGTAWSAQFGEASRHLAICEQCQRLVSMHRNSDRSLSALREEALAEATPGCPSDQAILELAAGIVSDKDAAPLLSHVITCPHCGPLLRRATEDFSDELSEKERRQITALESATPAWQLKMTQKVLPTPTLTVDLSLETRKAASPSLLRRKLFPAKLWPIWAGTLAAALALTVWFFFHTAPTPDVDQLLASAYSERRIMDLRIPGAPYAPLRQERSEGLSVLDQPQALLDANALISRQLKAHPEAPQWLLAKARADLLAFRYEPAMETLRRALVLQPDSRDVLVDLASAHFQRAEANSGLPADYGQAIEYLGRALAKKPDDPIALFNRAVAEDKLHLYDPAILDWQHYLRIDPSGPWADEARERLQKVEKKVAGKKASLRKPLSSPTQLASLQGTRELAEELNGRVEDYLFLTITQWLPDTFSPPDKMGESGKTRTALVALAQVLKDRHGDLWLADLLSRTHRADVGSAVTLLAAAVRANGNGDYAKGRASAHDAALGFRRLGNLAGELRAKAEEVYSDHLLYDGNSCINLVSNVRHQARQYGYAWLEAQMSLEAANCEDLVGELGKERTDIDLGTKLANDHEYPGLFLRGLGFEADSAGVLGDAQQDFLLASEGLNVFWTSQADLMKGYNLYTDLDTAADALRLPNLQVTLWQQATALIDLHPDLVQRAMAHRWFANSAYLANMPSLAAEEFARASALFAAAPATDATARGKMDADIWLAGLEVRRGELEKASTLLRQVENALARTPSFELEIGYYSAKAELSLQEKDPTATEPAIRTAIYLAECALRSFSSEGERRQWAQQTDRAYRNLVVWYLRQGNPRDALEFWEWYRGAEYRTTRSEASPRTNGLGPPTPVNVQAAPPLRPPTIVAERLPQLREQTMVSYAVFPEGTAVWVYDDRGIFSAWITRSAEELQSKTLQFQHLCSTPNSDISNLQSTAKTLYDLLIAPIENRLVPGRTLVFELDDALSAIPMEALVDRKGRYLGEETAVVFAPSLYETLRLHRPVPITPDTRALIVSVPAPADQNVAPLSDVEPESQAVSESFRSARWLKGPVATVAAIRREISHALVFHFSGHAVALPERNGLLLAEYDSRTQTARLIDAHSFSAEAVGNLQLAVLSACDTGRVERTGNSGNESLVQTLLRAGVPHVVASRWNVDSAQTAIFMHQFYSALMAGNNVAASLHSAQLVMFSRPLSGHPYYWAAFNVQGL
jgi:CHAT domain-containing protein